MVRKLWTYKSRLWPYIFRLFRSLCARRKKYWTTILCQAAGFSWYVYLWFLQCNSEIYLRVFPRLAPVTSFPALGTGYMFSRAWHWLHDFPRLAPVIHFPALGTSYLFSRALHWLHVFPRFVLVTYFPTLGAGYMFSRALHWLYVFPRFALLTCFPALRAGYTFSRAWHPLQLFVPSSDWYI